MKKIIFLILVISQLSVLAQKRTAKRYYQKGDYTNAALHYEKYLERYKHTKEVVANLADCYYKTFKFRDARYYTKKLMDGRFIDKDKSYDNQFNFKMYHILSALGNFEKAVDYLKIYYQNNNIPFNKKQAIEDIESFKLKTNDYRTKRIRLSNENAEFGAIQVNDSLFFVSDRTNSFWGKEYKWTHKPFLDIYKAKIIKNKVISSTIEPITEIINSDLHEGNFCFSNDKQTLYFSRNNSTFNDKKINTVQLFKSKKINGKWSKPEKLPFCKDEFSYQHPALNPTENKLYFSSNEEKTTEDFDIFYVEIDGKHEQYGSLVNLGTTINTKQREHFPFISKDGHLFFSSNGHLGLGMLDVFVSENVNGKFTKPINLGAPINSKYDDFSLIYSDEKHGYFASNRKFFNDDMYTFTQTGEIFIREYLVDFEVRDAETKKYIQTANVILQSKKLDTIYHNSINKFTVNIVPNTYTFKAHADTYISNQKTVTTNEKNNQKYILYLTKKPTVKKDTLKVITKIDSIKNNKRKPSIVTELDKRKSKLLDDKDGPKIIIKDNEMYFDMPPIYFEFGKWKITKESKKVLDKLAEKLERHKSVYINISSHTDKIGTDKYNKFLSEKRAEATRNYLALIGYVNARRMQFEGFGESQPLIDCEPCTEEEHQQNRRSEFKIIKY